MKILFPKNKKPALPGISNVADYAKRVAAGLTLPKKAIICPISSLTKYVTSHNKWKKYTCEMDIYVLGNTDICYVTNFGYGAPAMATKLEVLIALGVKEFVFIGLAGSLQEELQPGDLCLCSEALCDDGTSPCYVTTETVKPNKTLFAKLASALKAGKQNFHIGSDWTTDAIFRETKAEVKHYQTKDVLTVEMETAAFYAVCQKRNVRGVACYGISDKLYEYKWETHFGERATHRTLEVLFDAAKKALK